LRAGNLETRVIEKRNERKRLKVPRFKRPDFQFNFFRPASSSRRASSLAAVSAGESGRESKRAQPAHNNVSETVGSQYFKMSNCHQTRRQQ